MTRIDKSYLELIELKTFKERFEYLKVTNNVGASTFGGQRYLNQKFYSSPEWKRIRDLVILRDESCDLGVIGREIFSKALVHHINPIDIEMIKNRDPLIFDLNNLITVSPLTHQAIHYGDYTLIDNDLVIRTPMDTCPWKKRKED